MFKTAFPSELVSQWNILRSLNDRLCRNYLRFLKHKWSFNLYYEALMIYYQTRQMKHKKDRIIIIIEEDKENFSAFQLSHLPTYLHLYLYTHFLYPNVNYSTYMLTRSKISCSFNDLVPATLSLSQFPTFSWIIPSHIQKWCFLPSFKKCKTSWLHSYLIPVLFFCFPLCKTQEMFLRSPSLIPPLLFFLEPILIRLDIHITSWKYLLSRLWIVPLTPLSSPMANSLFSSYLSSGQHGAIAHSLALGAYILLAPPEECSPLIHF